MADDGIFFVGAAMFLGITAVVGAATFVALRVMRARRPDSSKMDPVGGSGTPLRDDFDRDDLPFGAFRQEIARTTFTLLPVARGPSPLGGRQWTFRYRVRQTGKTGGTWHLWCALVEVPRAWPYLGVERRSSDGALGIANRPEVPVPDDRTFRKRFVVRSDEASFTAAFVGDSVRQWLIENPGLAFMEVNCGLFVVVFDTDVGAELLPRLMTWTLHVLDRVPLSLWPSGERRVDPPTAPEPVT